MVLCIQKKDGYFPLLLILIQMRMVSGLSLNISLDDNSLDLDLALEVAEYFRLTKNDALKIIEDIKKSVTNWKSVANKHQLPRSEQEIMAKVFERFL